MKFYCIGDEHTVRGFRLAGISGKTVTSATEAASAVKMAAARRDCGVVILTETIAHSIALLVDQIRFEQERPLILVVPGPGGPVEERKGLRALVQEAVGIRLDLERKD
jgi:vacuolar-type H+-ATPase subunit F/Vma7